MKIRSLTRWCIAFAVVVTGQSASSSSAETQTISVAVASNFLLPMRVIANEYEALHDVNIKLSSGSSGKLYAQIVNGAPFDFFLSADQLKPLELENEGLGVDRRTYAYGRLVLWRQYDPFDGEISLDSPSEKKSGPLDLLVDLPVKEKLAVANPELAPYGLAALEVLDNLGRYNELEEQLVYGENVSQVYQFVQTGNASLGFVSLLQIDPKLLLDRPENTWLVPAELHSPIRQDMILLEAGLKNDAATDFYEWLQTPAARDKIESFGFILSTGNDALEFDPR